MAYNPNNPPLQIGSGALTSFNSTEAPSAPKYWLYASADPIATVQGAAYFANGIQLGMQVNDPVDVIDTNLQRRYTCFVLAVTPVAANNAATNTAFKGSGLGSATLNSTTTASST
jgi:hypothetical protein